MGAVITCFFGGMVFRIQYKQEQTGQLMIALDVFAIPERNPNEEGTLFGQTSS
jgi:hypothetical protein